MNPDMLSKMTADERADYEDSLARGFCEDCASGGDTECTSESCQQRRRWDRELLEYDRADLDD